MRTFPSCWSLRAGRQRSSKRLTARTKAMQQQTCRCKSKGTGPKVRMSDAADTVPQKIPVRRILWMATMALKGRLVPPSLLREPNVQRAVETLCLRFGMLVRGVSIDPLQSPPADPPLVPAILGTSRLLVTHTGHLPESDVRQNLLLASNLASNLPKWLLSRKLRRGRPLKTVKVSVVHVPGNLRNNLQNLLPQ